MISRIRQRYLRKLSIYGNRKRCTPPFSACTPGFSECTPYRKPMHPLIVNSPDFSIILASFTIKTTVFNLKTVVFLTFSTNLKYPKIPWVFARVLQGKIMKMEKGKNLNNKCRQITNLSAFIVYETTILVSSLILSINTLLMTSIRSYLAANSFCFSKSKVPSSFTGIGIVSFILFMAMGFNDVYSFLPNLLVQAGHPHKQNNESPDKPGFRYKEGDTHRDYGIGKYQPRSSPLEAMTFLYQ